MHWKDHLDSTLLGAYSLYDDATEGWKEVNGIITSCGKEWHILGGSGKKNILVGRTNLGKPIKINKAIGEVIEKISGSKNPDKWNNIPLTFYVDPRVTFGKNTVEAIRVKPQVGVVSKPKEKPVLEINTESFDKAKIAVEAGTFDLSKLKEYYTITEEVQIALGL